MTNGTTTYAATVVGNAIEVTSSDSSAFTLEVEKHRFVVSATDSGTAVNLTIEDPNGFNITQNGLMKSGLSQLVNPAGEVVRSTEAQQQNGDAIDFVTAAVTVNGPIQAGETWQLTIDDTVVVPSWPPRTATRAGCADRVCQRFGDVTAVRLGFCDSDR